jgi:transposase
MKSAVLQADWFDPEINPKLAEFCRHYKLHVVACRPGKPEHKGKVERGVAYLRNNALKGRRFAFDYCSLVPRSQNQDKMSS